VCVTESVFLGPVSGHYWSFSLFNTVYGVTNAKYWTAKLTVKYLMQKQKMWKEYKETVHGSADDLNVI